MQKFPHHVEKAEQWKFFKGTAQVFNIYKVL